MTFKDTSCKSSTLAIDNTIKLTYLNDDASKRCEVKIEDSNGTTYSISDSIPHTDMLEVFDDQNGVTSRQRNTNLTIQIKTTWII